MSALLLKYKLGEESLGEDPVLAGYKDSLASSLEYALSKKPLWLLEMFGTTKAGVPRSKQLFLTSNPRRSRGPVVVVVNPKKLSPKHISVSHNQFENVSTKEIKDIYLAIVNSYERTSESIRTSRAFTKSNGMKCHEDRSSSEALAQERDAAPLWSKPPLFSFFIDKHREV